VSRSGRCFLLTGVDLTCEMIERQVLERREWVRKASKFPKWSLRQQLMQYHLILLDASA